MLLGAGPVAAQGTLIQGRVLERAALKPVPGASVRLTGRPGFTAVTDAKGVFKIASPASAVRVPGPLREFPTLPGRRTFIPEGDGGYRWFDPSGMRDASGRSLSGHFVPPLAAGLSPTPSPAPAYASARAPAAGKTSSAVPGPLEVACAGLVTRQVPVDADTVDLGDIVLEYPPRKFDIGVKPIYGAIPLFDGSRASMDSEWEHWMGTYRLKNALGPVPIVWEFLEDPVDSGMTMRTCCRIQWGDEDLVTKRKFRDFQLHVEFNPVSAPRTGAGAGPANSGVYLQSLYEIQIKDDLGLVPLGNHDAGGILNEFAAPENLCRPRGQWQAYDITFRAARFKNGARSEKARLTMYWNGKLVHKDKETANEHNTGVSSDSLVDEPKGLKLQSEGHDVRFRNVWIKELDLTAPNTDLGF
ncbi:MAG: hypothetical protein JWP91_1845 [Fibrobacteres bacterium]|nr:hypothetical protein [Fibrobacterota bacterium]